MAQQINLISSLTEILKASDLSIITAEGVRSLLEQEYNLCLKDQEKSVETLVMDCFYELQIQQNNASMPEQSSSSQESHFITSTSIEAPSEVNLSEEERLMMVNMQLPDYDSFSAMGSFPTSNTSSMATNPQYISYSTSINSQNHLTDIQNQTYSFIPPNQGHQLGSDQSFHSQTLNLGSTAGPHSTVTPFPSQVTPSYVPYYQFQPSTEQSNNKSGFVSQQPYLAGVSSMPHQPSQHTQIYNQDFRLQQMKKQLEGPLINGHPYQQQSSNIQQRRFDNGFLGNEQSWPSTVAKLRQMNIKTNIKKKVGKAKKKRRTATTSNDPNAPPKPKRNTGLNRPLVLSATLAAFIGCSEVSFG
jgi:hypothetical protein